MESYARESYRSKLGRITKHLWPCLNGYSHYMTLNYYKGGWEMEFNIGQSIEGKG